MKTNFAGLKSVTLLGLFSISAAHAQSVINFSALTPGTQITSQYAAQGLTFATEDANGDFGTPAIGMNPYLGGLANTPNGDYPTTEYLILYFTDPATVQSFSYNNYGTGTPSFYNAFDSSDTLIGSGSLSNVEGSTVALNLADVSMLRFSNGQTLESQNWEFVVGSISFTVTPVPEPTTLALAGLSGLGLLRFHRRK
jgi:hypothetical protein